MPPWRSKGHSPQPSQATFPQGIKVLHDATRAIVDVVFIHGLTGDYLRTWTHPSSDEPWPKTLLSRQLPIARILTFGYDAYLVRKIHTTSQNTLADHSSDLVNALVNFRNTTQTTGRPIIFVTHSLGGLVCKDALLFSRHPPEPYLEEVFACTRAIAFMGTPHTGSGLANWSKIPASALGVIKSTNTSLLQLLRTDSEILERIQNDFLIMLRHPPVAARQLSVACFFEALPLPVFGKVVEKQSATFDGYNRISIHANHSDMVKFVDEDDPGFVSFLGVLSRWVGSLAAPQQAPAEVDKLEKERCLQSLAFPEMGFRAAAIEQPIQGTCTWIFESEEYQRWSHRSTNAPILWIKGKPGSGKSTLLRHIARRSQEEASRYASNVVCLVHYFNRRGSPLERTVLGLYLTLTHILFRHSESSFAAIFDIYCQKRDLLPADTKVTWHVQELAQIFHQLISRPQTIHRPDQSPQIASFRILIDALDECNDAEIRRFVSRVEESLEESYHNGVQLRFCWASRHYPHISAKESLDLHLEDLNAPDITLYVQEKLSRRRQDHLLIELQRDVVRRSDGVFLWTIFAVDRLLKASDQGLDLHAMQACLQDMPEQLDEIFLQTWSSIDAVHRKISLFVMYWTICACEPLTLDILDLGVNLMANLQLRSLRQLMGSPLASRNTVRYEHFIRDATGGLVESKRSGGSAVVQVVHETVREFFISGRFVATIKSQSSMAFEVLAHRNILAACAVLLGVDEIHPYSGHAVHGDETSLRPHINLLYQTFQDPLETMETNDLSGGGTLVQLAFYASRFFVDHLYCSELFSLTHHDLQCDLRRGLLGYSAIYRQSILEHPYRPKLGRLDSHLFPSNQYIAQDIRILFDSLRNLRICFARLRQDGIYPTSESSSTVKADAHYYLLLWTCEVEQKSTCYNPSDEELRVYLKDARSFLLGLHCSFLEGLILRNWHISDRLDSVLNKVPLLRELLPFDSSSHVDAGQATGVISLWIKEVKGKSGIHLSCLRAEKEDMRHFF